MPAKPATGSSTLWPLLWSFAQLVILNGKIDEYRSTTKLHGQAKKQERKKLLLELYKALKPLHPKQTTAKWAKVKAVCDISPNSGNGS
jgi:hypothetical protein